jgi:hypothetical protein
MKILAVSACNHLMRDLAALVRDEGVVGSNPIAPTICFQRLRATLCSGPCHAGQDFCQWMRGSQA